MKTLLITGAFKNSELAFGAQNEKKEEKSKKTIESCTYCTKTSTGDTVCATAENCKDAKKLMEETVATLE